jgi:hypothetical protein
MASDGASRHHTMKTLPIFAALAVLTTTGVVHAAPVTCQVPVQAVDVDTRVDNALEKFRTRASNAGASLADPAVKEAYDELIASLRAAYAAMANTTPTAQTIRTRLSEAINDLLARAQKIAIDQAEFRALQIDILNHRVRNAVNQAMYAYKTGAGTIEDLKRIQRAMTQAADAAKADLPELSELRAKVNARIDELIARATVLATDLEPIDQDIAATSVKAWSKVLENHTLAKIYNDTDWNRSKNAINDHLVLVGNPTNLADIQKRLMRILDGLKAKVIAGTITPADFESLKTEITAYARAAVK